MRIAVDASVVRPIFNPLRAKQGQASEGIRTEPCSGTHATWQGWGDAGV